MVADGFLKLLVCPESRAPLTEADAALVGQLNAAIAQGSLKNKAGRTLETPLDGALVRADGDLVYPIVDAIPILIVDEAIVLSQLPARA